MSQQKIVATMNLGHQAIHPKSRESLQAAADRWQADYLELTEPWGLAQPTNIMGAKLELDLIPVDAESRVCYIDGDCLVAANCPDPFDLVHPERFGAVLNFQHDTHDGHPALAHQPIWNRMRPWFGLDHVEYHPDHYFNGGFLLYTPARHEAIWRVARERIAAAGQLTEKVDPMIEQTGINLAARLLEIPLTLLDRSFNRLGPAVWTLTGPMNCYIAHLANLANYSGRANKHAAIDRIDWKGN